MESLIAIPLSAERAHSHTVTGKRIMWRVATVDCQLSLLVDNPRAALYFNWESL